MTDKEKKNAYNRARYSKKKDEINRKRREHYQKHKDEINAYKREYARNKKLESNVLIEKYPVGDGMLERRNNQLINKENSPMVIWTDRKIVEYFKGVLPNRKIKDIEDVERICGENNYFSLKTWKEVLKEEKKEGKNNA